MTAAVLIVVLSGMLHAYWNYLAKRSLHKHAFLWHAQWIAVAAFAPLAVGELALKGLAAGAWPYLLWSMALHGLYIRLLASAYTFGDLSRVYPILRGTAPLVVPIVGVLLLGESMSATGWFGIASIVAGIAVTSVSGKRAADAASDSKTVFVALMIGIVISAYVVMDKLAVDHGVPPITLNLFSNAANGVALCNSALHSGAWRREWSLNRRSLIAAGIAASGGYLLFLFALQMLPVAKLAPMREIGTVFGTVLGIALLKEAAGARRIAASIAITFGIFLLALSQ
jgi:drug/metabolite transporter (DMT)-like permease